MRILITGVTGFVGSHLAETLLAGGDVEIHGLCRTGRWPDFLRHLDNGVTLHRVDLCDCSELTRLLTALAPDQLYHLAGYAATGPSFKNPDAAWTGNLSATRSLFDAIARSNGRPRILHVSSAAIYAAPTSAAHALDESAPLAPLSPYAASKAAADLLAYQVTHHPGLDVVRVRPFNQIGPRQSPQFAVASFARQLARIELGLAPPRLETGDLSARRDLSDVRDMVRAYVALMDRGVRGQAYNAGRGSTFRIGDVLTQLCELSESPPQIVTQAERLRPADAAVLVANSSKLRAATAWTPQIPLAQTLHDTLDFWRHTESTALSQC
jgi:GDP-4-dehydro-6-deoxy-D-mannose reductase